MGLHSTFVLAAGVRIGSFAEFDVVLSEVYLRNVRLKVETLNNNKAFYIAILKVHSLELKAPFSVRLTDLKMPTAETRSGTRTHCVESERVTPRPP